VFIIPEAFVIAAKPKPSLGVPSPGGLLVVPEGNARVKRNILGESAR
jgi:hypothetical protein